MKETDIAYLAGIIDGEGCISMYQISNGHGKSVMCGLWIANTDKNLMDWLVENLGGSLNTRTSKKPQWKTSWVWAVYSQNMEDVLIRVLPYLKVKHTQAELALRARELMKRSGKNGKGYNQEIANGYNSIVTEFKGLNQRGVALN